MNKSIESAKYNNATDHAVMMAMNDLIGKFLLGCIDDERVKYIPLGMPIWVENDGSFVLAMGNGNYGGISFDDLEKGLKEHSIIVVDMHGNVPSEDDELDCCDQDKYA